MTNYREKARLELIDWWSKLSGEQREAIAIANGVLIVQGPPPPKQAVREVKPK